MVLPKRRGVLMRISCAIQSQLFFCKSCPCMRAKVPGFSSLKKERAVARMKSYAKGLSVHIFILEYTGTAHAGAHLSCMYRMEEVLVKAAFPAEGVELAEEAVTAVHVIHRAQFRLLGLWEPGLVLPAHSHELFDLVQTVLQAGHETSNLRA
ncbi:MAG: hypothetical protein EBR09_12015 [Proteobacteria bacterium]|nr:hypothetical protein [Pseudomonadota bacterium]